MKLLWGVLSLLLLAGCDMEQMRPPTAQGRIEIAARTAKAKFTKIEVKSQPATPRAGQVSIWDIKVFKIEDKPDGLREEWKFFAPLGNTNLPSGAPSTEDLMQIEVRDAQNRLVLQNTPTYKAYGSFLTDFKIPQAGQYTLVVRYQPSEKGRVFPMEVARKKIEVAP